MCALLVQVTLCANTVKAYRLALVVDVDGVGEEIRTLPINARSGVRVRSCLLRCQSWTNACFLLTDVLLLILCWTRRCWTLNAVSSIIPARRKCVSPMLAKCLPATASWTRSETHVHAIKCSSSEHAASTKVFLREPLKLTVLLSTVTATSTGVQSGAKLS